VGEITEPTHIDSASGSHSAQSVQSKFLGEKIPRAEIVYFAQLFLCLTLIITSVHVVMLALKDPSRDFWMVTLSSLVGYIIPSPQMGSIKQPRPSTEPSVHHG
jgi:hypothetical protein